MSQIDRERAARTFARLRADIEAREAEHIESMRVYARVCMAIVVGAFVLPLGLALLESWR